MNYKVEKIALNNFKKVSKLEIKMHDKLYLIGRNGSGKSSIIEAFLIAMLGKQAIKKDFRADMIKDGATQAEVSTVIVGEDGIKYEITRTILNDDVKVKIKSSDKNVKINQEFLNKIFNRLAVSPMEFALKTPREQAELLNINTSEYDREIENLVNYREAQFRIKTKSKGYLETLNNPPKVERVDINSLLDEKQKIYDFNNQQNEKTRAIVELETEIANTENKITELTARIIELEKTRDKLADKRENLKNARKTIPTPEELKNPDIITGKITNAQQINQMADKYEEWEKASRTFENDSRIYDELNNQIASARQSKIDYIQSINLPLEGLSIDDAGGLTLNGKYFNSNYFSTGEIIKYSTQLVASLNPDLKTIFISNANLLDDQNLEYISRLPGYQIVFEIVGDTPLGDNYIVLNEQSIKEEK